MELLGVLVGFLLGGGGVYFFLKRNEKEAQNPLKERILSLENENKVRESAHNQERTKVLELSNEVSRKEVQLNTLEQKLSDQKVEIENLQEKFTKEFQILANNIFEEKSKKFADQNKSNLSEILIPLKDKIIQFERKVDENAKESTARHASLREQLFHLKDLNQKITKEAENLTKALKGDSKTQGNWGEIILESILEKSGLRNGEEFITQESYTQNGSRFRPDVVVKLPEGKSIIIDSKVSLTAYDRYVNSEDENLGANELKMHINSLRNHLKDLSSKEYQSIEGIGSLDFILMFIPIEAAFSLALQNDSALFNDAYSKNIVIVSPTTLLATLRTIANSWKHEHQNRNALKIAKESAALYDKFKAFTDDLIKLGKNLKQSTDNYELAMNKLVNGKGNLIRKTEQLSVLGVEPKYEIDSKLLDRAEE